MDVTLIVVGGDTTTSEVKLSLPTVMGRGQECKLRLPQPLVSRKHCELFELNGRLFVRDLGSMNGTYVGSERIGEAELPHEGLLTIGAITFRALYEAPDAFSSDHATQNDFGTETKSDIVVDQSVEMAGPMDPIEIDDFEGFGANPNDLTQPAPRPTAKDVHQAGAALPPAVGEQPEDVARTE